LALDPDDPLDMAETLALKLTPPDRKSFKPGEEAVLGKLEANFASWFGTLSRAQKRVVVRFLEALAAMLDGAYDSNPAQEALDGFWAKHDPGAQVTTFSSEGGMLS
jgi:hypothetical protein